MAGQNRTLAMDKSEFVLMTVQGLGLDPITKTPILMLRDEQETISLPIWIGLLEATSMATELEGVKMSRPMTHDLLKQLIEECGAQVSRIEVTALRDNTFYAVIHIDVNGSPHTIDSRPSDAISLALRTQSPIYVAKQVLEAHMADQDDPDGTEEGEKRPDDRDLSEISPERWPDILEGLDPDDFKYKM